jgi:hypothetical protein
MITEYLTKKALDASFRSAKSLAKRILEEKKGKLVTTREQVEESLNIHLTSVHNWSSEVSFSDLKRAKLTSEIFIELDLYVYPRRIRLTAHETIKSIALSKLFDEEASHFILLGQPGAGKTTSMKYVCQKILQDPDFYPERFSLPVLVRLRDLNTEWQDRNSTVLFDYIGRLIGLDVQFPLKGEGSDDNTPLERREIRKKLVVSFLESLKVLLILDGFDELSSDSLRLKTIGEIQELTQYLNKSTVIVTSRTGDFRYNVERAAPYELCPLTQVQVAQFALRWLINQEKANKLIEKIYLTPFADTAIRPLTLAHLCAIYERIEDIPEKPKTIYKKIVNLLLEEWDLQRTIKRKSKYARFEVDRKYEFLCNLAYVLTVTLRKTSFTSANIAYVYEQICDQFGLEKNESAEVVAELETHNGLILQTGYEQFEFAHKSLQEFLTAEYLVKLPSIPSWGRLGRLPNEIAIAVAISSNPGEYCAELVLRRFQNRLSEDFMRAFINRLIIEKPDWWPTPPLQLALLVLLSEYLELSFIDVGRPRTYQGDRLLFDLEKLVKDSNKTGTLSAIMNCYVTEQIYETLNPDSIQRLTLDRQYMPQWLESTDLLFPNTLFLRTSMLKIQASRTK